MPANGCTKPFAGIISFEKQDSRSTDIFDTKVDLNPTIQNFSRLKLDILTKRPVSDLSISENRSWAFLLSEVLIKMIFG